MSNPTTKSVKCTRNVRDASLDVYRLPDDGRSWRAVARSRQALALYLSTFADGDGSRIYPAVATITAHFQWDRATTFRRLKDLGQLGLLKKVGRIEGHGGRGPALRELNVKAFTEVAGSPDDPAGVASSDQSGVASSNPEVASSRPGVASSKTEVAPSCDTDRPLLTVTNTATSTATPRNEINQAVVDDRMEEEGFDQEQNLTDEEIAAAEAHDEALWQDEAERLWRRFNKQIPEEMYGARITSQQQKQIKEQLMEEFSEQPVLAAIRTWIKLRELPIEGKKFNKWGCWLDPGDGGPFWDRKRKELMLERRNETAAKIKEVVRQRYPGAICGVPEPGYEFIGPYGVVIGCRGGPVGIRLYPFVSAADNFMASGEKCRAVNCCGNHRREDFWP